MKIVRDFSQSSHDLYNQNLPKYKVVTRTYLGSGNNTIMNGVSPVKLSALNNNNNNMYFHKNGYYNNGRVKREYLDYPSAGNKLSYSTEHLYQPHHRQIEQVFF